MKILHWLGNAGKVSAAALAGLGGVAAVGGVAAWVYLGGENTDNTSFNFAGNQPSNIVYSVGGNRDYNTGSGEGGSDLLVSSRNIHILDEQIMREEEAAEMVQSHRSAEQAFNTSGGAALLGNSGYEGDKIGQFQGAGDNPALALAGLNDAIARAQGGMGGGTGAGGNGAGGQGGANGGAEGKGGSEGGAPALGSHRPDWGRSAALGGGNGGSGVNNQFVMQGNGLGRAADGAGNVMAQAANALQKGNEAVQSQINGALGAGGKFRKADRLGNNLDSGAGKGNQDRNKALNRLRFAQKRSADEARNKHRFANTTAFIGGERNAGGITLSDGSSVSTGMGQESKDMSGNFKAGLSRLPQLETELLDEELLKERDKSKLKNQLVLTTVVAIAAMIAIPLLMYLAKSAGIWAWVFYAAAALVALAALAMIVSLIVKTNQYASNYGGSGFATLSFVLGGLLAVGVGASFIFKDTFLKVISKGSTLIGCGNVTVGQAVLLTGAGAIVGSASQVTTADAWKNTSKEELNKLKQEREN